MRPTIALACILKNEAHNISRLLQSVRDCFDEIVMVDTGSTDNSVQFLEKVNIAVDCKEAAWTGIPKINIQHFKWIDDFAAARRYAFSFAKSDYVMWLDLDDVLANKEEFIKWRDTVMHTAHYWLARYNYNRNEQGIVDCTFLRERVVKNNYGFDWEYPVHEGLIQKEKQKVFWPNRVNTWHVDHHRSEEDKKQDFKRNVTILDKLVAAGVELSPRMLFYHGKEMFENGKPVDACGPLLKAVQSEGLEFHDKILAIQYAVQSAMAARAYDQALDLCLNGLKLVPARAELYCLMGDTYMQMNRIQDAIISFKNAKNCPVDTLGGVTVNYFDSHGKIPAIRLAEIYSNLGQFDEAEKHINDLESIHKFENIYQIKKQFYQMKEMGVVRDNLPKSNDIVITCPAMPIPEWDEHKLANQGLGGSETAAVEVSRWIKKKTGFPVKIFHPRMKRDVMPSGVEYIPIEQAQGYFQNVEPLRHIMWRHPHRLTKAKSFLWCHDLVTPGAEKQEYDRFMALSQFHVDYTYQMQGIHPSKIDIITNGINPSDFDFHAVKNPNKIIFSSSPDRGLDRAIWIVEKAREMTGKDLELHLFYGFDGMKNGPLRDMAIAMEGMIAERPWVKYHGMVHKKVLYGHMKEAVAWIYPANFIETYCITAIEALCCGTYPLVRHMGALPNVLGPAKECGMATILERDCVTKDDVTYWASELVKVLEQKLWEKVVVDPQDHSWEKAADRIMEVLGLPVVPSKEEVTQYARAALMDEFSNGLQEAVN